MLLLPCLFLFAKKIPGTAPVVYSAPAIPLPLQWVIKTGFRPAPWCGRQSNALGKLVGGRRARFWNAGFKLSGAVESHWLGQSD